MNQFLKHIILSGFFILHSLFSCAEDCMDAIQKSIEKGNAAAVAGYFADNVSLNLPGNQATYSSAQAEIMLNDFFRKNAPSQINIEQNGTNSNAKFVIARFVTSHKKTYRVYWVVKDCIIKELRFE